MKNSKKAAKEQYRQDLDGLVRAGHKKAVAKRILDEVIDEVAAEFQIGMLIQYHEDGLRAGYIADTPSHGQVKVQPIGPRGSEEPNTRYVKLDNVVKIVPTPKENTMTAIAAKATSIKETAAKKLEAKAEVAKANLSKKPVKGQDAAAKPAKKAVVAKEAKPSKKEDTGAKKIKVLVKENPKREGSASFKTFALYAKSKTVAEFIKAGGTMADIRWDVNKEFISLS